MPLQRVAAETVLVGGRMAGLVDAAVDGAAEMLEEGAVDALVDRADAEIPMDRNARFHSRRVPRGTSAVPERTIYRDSVSPG
jgi:hypothetical protein